MIDWDALAGAGLRLLGDYCDGPHGGEPIEGVFRVPGGPAFWYCKSCFPQEWIRMGRPELPRSAPA